MFILPDATKSSMQRGMFGLYKMISQSSYFISLHISPAFSPTTYFWPIGHFLLGYFYSSSSKLPAWNHKLFLSPDAVNPSIQIQY